MDSCARFSPANPYRMGSKPVTSVGVRWSQRLTSRAVIRAPIPTMTTTVRPSAQIVERTVRSLVHSARLAATKTWNRPASEEARAPAGAMTGAMAWLTG